MNHLDLFSGIGAWGLASKEVWPDREMVGFVEIEEFPQNVLKKNFPGVPIYGDIKQFNGKKFRGIELLTGSPPCQSASQAGQRRGKKDDRWLWGEAARVLGEVRPRWAIFENVYGLVTLDDGMAFASVISDLESQDYQVWPVVIPACAVGAGHRRNRVWFLCHSNRHRESAKPLNAEVGVMQKATACLLPNPKRDGLQGRSYEGRTKGKKNPREQQLARLLQPSPEAAVSIARSYRASHGVPTRMDVARNKALGNAIVPQVAVEIMKAIQAAEQMEL